MELSGIWQNDIDWIHLAEESDQWRALVNMTVNLLVP
jgi:hypothetical protein